MITARECSEAGDDLVRVRVHGASGTILLNQAARKNVLSQPMLAQLREALHDLHQESRVRAVILTGAGDTFCAGADLAEVQALMDDSHAQDLWFSHCSAQKELIEAMLRFPKPIVSAVNGPALGMGATLVLASDLVVATKSAVFGFPEVHRGLVAGLGTPLLTFRAGAAVAANLLLRGEPASAADCQQWGLYQWIVDEHLVWAKADEIAKYLNKTSQPAVAMTKRLLNETVGEQLIVQLAAGAAASASARTTESAAEGVAAFLEKREPRWP